MKNDVWCHDSLEVRYLVNPFLLEYSFGNVQIWHSNMPHNKIADRKGHQGWMKREGPYFIFPGGGTMFPDGAVQYIEKLGQYIPISRRTLRTALDMGCGVRAIVLCLFETISECIFS